MVAHIKFAFFFLFMAQVKIIVIGAGVIGITTALLLKQKGYEDVKIIAKHVPGNMDIQYTSPYAGTKGKKKGRFKQLLTFSKKGAHWRTMAPNNDLMLQSKSVPSTHIGFCFNIRI